MKTLRPLHLPLHPRRHQHGEPMIMKRVFKYLATAAVACFMVAAFQSRGVCSTKAQQVEFLLSQVRTTAGPLAGGTVAFYAAGTTTPKTIWLDRDKNTVAANPYTLDANGTAQLYAEGLYKVVIKNAAGSTVYTRDNLAFTAFAASGSASNSAALGGYFPDTGAVGLTIPVRDANGNIPGIASATNAVTLDSTQTIAGFKNFSGGMKSTTTASLSPEINVTWFASGPTSNLTAAVTAANTYAASIGRGTLVIPVGEYVVNNVSLSPYVSVRGAGPGQTVVKRNANNPVFKVDGPDYPTMPQYQNNLTGMTITSDGNYSEPLVSYTDATSFTIRDVVFDAYGCQHLQLWQAWDFRVVYNRFLNGGTVDGTTPSVSLKSGYGHRQTKEGDFIGNHFEGYAGPAIAVDSEADEGGKKTELITLGGNKFESRVCTGRHLNFYLASGITFAGGDYVTTYLVPDTETLVSFGLGQQIKGSIGIYFSADSTVFPQSAVKLAGMRFVDLLVNISSLQPSTMWAFDYDGANQKDVHIDATAPYPTVNGRYLNQRTLLNSTVRQLGTTSDSTQYVWAKDTHPDWSMGNPFLNGSYEELYFRVNDASSVAKNMMRFQRNQTSGYQNLLMNSHLMLGRVYDSPSQLRLGDTASGFVFWVDTQNRLRRTGYTGESAPASDTAGYAFQTNLNGITASRPASPEIGQMFFDLTLDKPIWWNGSVWKLADSTIAP